MDREIEQRQGMAKFERKVLPNQLFKRVWGSEGKIILPDPSSR